jgi:hypothetical protein
MSGRSRFLAITAKLETPPTVSLAIFKFVAPINSIGHPRIPTPSGMMKINDVYFCKGIKGSILLT